MGIYSAYSYKKQIPINRMVMLDSILFDWDSIGNDWEDKFKLMLLYK